MNKPSLSWPNRITLLRILLIVPYVRLMLQLNDEAAGPWPRRIALLLFVIMALSDGLDGYLARSRGMITTLGKILDPLADKLLVDLGYICVAANPHFEPGVPLWFPVLLLMLGCAAMVDFRVKKVQLPFISFFLFSCFKKKLRN